MGAEARRCGRASHDELLVAVAAAAGRDEASEGESEQGPSLLMKLWDIVDDVASIDVAGGRTTKTMVEEGGDVVVYEAARGRKGR